MFKQFFINRFFNKLTSEDFFQNDDEAVIGKAKDVIQSLKDQIEYVKNPDHEFDKEEATNIIDNSNDLINEIENTYHNKNNVVGIVNSPMAGFFVLQDKKSLYLDLKEYYEDMRL